MGQFDPAAIARKDVGRGAVLPALAAAEAMPALRRRRPRDGRAVAHSAGGVMRHPITLAAIADWLGLQPAGAPYCYTDRWACAFAQYLNFLGTPFERVLPYGWVDAAGNMHAIPIDIERALQPSGGQFSTFGAAAQRARAVLAQATGE